MSRTGKRSDVKRTMGTTGDFGLQHSAFSTINWVSLWHPTH